MVPESSSLDESQDVGQITPGATGQLTPRYDSLQVSQVKHSRPTKPARQARPVELDGRAVCEPRRALLSQTWPALRTGLPMVAVDALAALITLVALHAMPGQWDGYVSLLGPGILGGTAAVLAVMFVAGNYPGSATSANDEMRRVCQSVVLICLLQILRSTTMGLHSTAG